MRHPRFLALVAATLTACNPQANSADVLDALADGDATALDIVLFPGADARAFADAMTAEILGDARDGGDAPDAGDVLDADAHEDAAAPEAAPEGGADAPADTADARDASGDAG